MSVAGARTYSITDVDRVLTTAVRTLIQIMAGTTTPLELVRAWVSQSSSTVSTQLQVQINRKTATATGMSAGSIKKLGPASDPSPRIQTGGGNTSGVFATAEGTDGDVLVPDVWNYLTGWVWTPLQKSEMIFVDVAEMIALKLPTAPGAGVTVTCGMIFTELR